MMMTVGVPRCTFGYLCSLFITCFMIFLSPSIKTLNSLYQAFIKAYIGVR